jgi:peptidoglycan/xylan/chitin deacetylase (PgdA/CDA1 family)
MYHYVREYAEDFPQFKFLSIDDFRLQLDYFEKHFGFVTKSDWLRCVQDNHIDERVKGKVLLTFDDAMSCHFNYVFPELIKRDLWGIFYVPSKPYREHTLLDVHKIHLLTGKYEGKLLLETLSGLIENDNLTFETVESFKTQTYEGQNNEFGISAFKRALNYFMAEGKKTEVLDSICEKLNFTPTYDDFYVSKDALGEMHNAGMIIGSHSSSHTLMSKLNRDKQEAEIRESISLITEVTQAKCSTYCHPFGGDHSFNNDTLQLLNEFDVDYSFSVEPRDVMREDLLSKRHSLPRYDCNKFPHGQVSNQRKEI